MSVFFTRRGPAPVTAPPVGTTWLYEEDGSFAVPATGLYQIEMHGGGGGAVLHSAYPNYDSCTGGGSGELHEVTLTKNEVIPVTIGAGGAYTTYTNYNYGDGYGKSGGTTTFGSLSIAGGGAGRAGQNQGAGGGSASGSLATAGTSWSGDYAITSLAGGYGNKNNTSQTYGNGGCFNGGTTASRSGQAGAVIITYLGKE